MIKIVKVDAKDWRGLESEKAHYLTFGDFRARELERFDFTLLGFKDETLIGYFNCKEMDAETLYIQTGGALPEAKGTVNVVPGCIAGVDWMLERYKRVTGRIENTNRPMLKIALMMGFLVCGTWNFNGKIYLELLKEKEV